MVAIFPFFCRLRWVVCKTVMLFRIIIFNLIKFVISISFCHMCGCHALPQTPFPDNRRPPPSRLRTRTVFLKKTCGPHRLLRIDPQISVIRFSVALLTHAPCSFRLQRYFSFIFFTNELPLSKHKSLSPNSLLDSRSTHYTSKVRNLCTHAKPASSNSLLFLLE